MAAIKLMGLAMAMELVHDQQRVAGPTKLRVLGSHLQECEGPAELKVLTLGSSVLQISETLHHLWVAGLP